MGGIVPTVIETSDAIEITSFIMGSIGCFLMLGTYTLNILDKLETGDPRYCLANGLGGIFAMVGALLEALQGSFGSYPLVVLEGAWGIIGLIEWLRIITRPKNANVISEADETVKPAHYAKPARESMRSDISQTNHLTPAVANVRGSWDYSKRKHPDTEACNVSDSCDVDAATTTRVIKHQGASESDLAL